MSKVILTEPSYIEGIEIVRVGDVHITTRDWYCDLDVGTIIIYNAKKLTIAPDGHTDLSSNFRRTRLLIKTISKTYLVVCRNSYINLEWCYQFTVLRTFHA